MGGRRNCTQGPTGAAMTVKHLLVTNDFPPKVGGIQSVLWSGGAGFRQIHSPFSRARIVTHSNLMQHNPSKVIRLANLYYCLTHQW